MRIKQVFLKINYFLQKRLLLYAIALGRRGIKLKNKVAVVTSANSGIGLAIAKRYAEQGAKVVLAARREDKLLKRKKQYKVRWQSVSVMWLI